MKLEYGIAIVASAIAIGCTSARNPYEIDGAPVYDTKSLAVTEMVELLISDPGFSSMYEKAKGIAKSRGRELPTIVVAAPIENNCGAGVSDRVFGQMFRELQISLRRTGKFRVIDYSLAKIGIDIVLKEPDNGIRPDNIQNYGNYAPADFWMFCQVGKDGSKLYFLNAQIIDQDMTIAADGSVRFKRLK